MEVSRRRFVGGTLAAGVIGAAGKALFAEPATDAIAQWHKETEQISPEIYKQYLQDGKTNGLVTLEKLEASAAKVLREVKDTTVGDIPAVWSVYNMGYIVKTRESLFSIDLVHRRDTEFAPMLDFALITHNHRDHWRSGFYEAMNGLGAGFRQ